LKSLIDYGETALSDRILSRAELNEPEIRVPLTLVQCTECSLVQIRETVEPEVLFFSDYPYFSSVSPALMRHFGESAAEILTTRELGPESLVMEAASNDGYMLRHFREAGIPVLGIDPAEAPVRRAREVGVDTLNAFFTQELALQLVREGKHADIFLANNVIAHVADLNGFMEGVATVLKEDGLAVMEIHYVVSLVDHCEFDTVYHQHVCYYTVTALSRLFRRHGLFLNDVRRIPIHGGSIRLFVEKRESVSDSVRELMAMEADRGVLDGSYFMAFTQRVTDVRSNLMTLLDRLKGEGKTIAGYGAAAKANTLLAYCGIGDQYLEFIADLNPYKHGKYMSGNRLPILPPEAVTEHQPDYLLILAWNFAEEIMKQLSDYSAAGGRFIVPIPEPKILVAEK